ncbi:5'-methylthioadenosine/S-adenosylhomocysteine nucleosidase [Coraliomargarita parva]|uniref:5'-methylthioadenosine/S-adenosylhomocysteine nucleosidase n=1 Tax=Coraliomargarita parva TaxID=3014050 RepID=UPI0022B41D7E|nr:5'-methylthioadenosine/S-adenosylhomocysteine nucleosidase [Coraliomargarita parva]
MQTGRYLLCCLLFPLSLFAEGRIAIVSAYAGELQSVMKELGLEEFQKVEELNGIRFYFAEVYGKQILLFKTNVSTVNAAMNTQLAFSNFDIDLLIFSGIAGGVNPELEKGDISIPDRWTYHTEGGYFNEEIDPRQYAGSRFRDVNPYGMFYPAPVRVARGGQTTPVVKPYFHADEDLLNLAKTVLQDMDMLNAHGENATIKVGGLGLTGPVFMDNRDYRDWLYQEWAADCVAMESAAIAQVCWANQVPFLIIRALSDLAGGQEGANEIEEFAAAAEDNSAEVVARILKAL